MELLAKSRDKKSSQICWLWFLKTLIGLQLQDNSRWARKKKVPEVIPVSQSNLISVSWNTTSSVCAFRGHSEVIFQYLWLSKMMRNLPPSVAGQEVKRWKLLRWYPCFSTQPTRSGTSAAPSGFSSPSWESIASNLIKTQGIAEKWPNWIGSKYLNLVNGKTPGPHWCLFCLSFVRDMCLMYIYIYYMHV